MTDAEWAIIASFMPPPTRRLAGWLAGCGCGHRCKNRLSTARDTTGRRQAGGDDGRVPGAALRRRDHSLGGSLVRWYCRYGISYRELEEMMGERGVAVDHTTLYRWTQRYAPAREARGLVSQPAVILLAVDETYVRVKGQWKYLYRAIDKDGATLDFYLADRRNAKTAKHFLSAAVKRSRDWIPRVINTDKNPAYGEAIAELKQDGRLPKERKRPSTDR